MKDYKTKEDLNLVISLDKPEMVIRIFFEKYKQGLAFNEFVGSLKDKYNELYGSCEDCYEYIRTNDEIDPVSGSVVTTYIFDESLYEDGELIDDVKEAIKEGRIKPSFEFYKNQQIEQYKDITVTDDDFKEFYSQYAIDKLNKQRDEELKSIVVYVDDIPLNGDELSQTRMSRAISVMADDDSILWICADNKLRDLTKNELITALRLSGEKQTEIWARYKELKDEWR